MVELSVDGNIFFNCDGWQLLSGHFVLEFKKIWLLYKIIGTVVFWIELDVILAFRLWNFEIFTDISKLQGLLMSRNSVLEKWRSAEIVTFAIPWIFLQLMFSAFLMVDGVWQLNLRMQLAFAIKTAWKIQGCRDSNPDLGDVSINGLPYRPGFAN